MYKRGVADLRGDDRPGARLPRAARRSAPRSACPRSSPRSSRPTARASGCCAPTPAQAFETVLHPGDRPRHAVHLLAGGLRARLLLLLHRAAGLQPQPDGRRDRRPGAGSRTASSGLQAGGASQHHQRRADGHGRAAGELPQRRAGHAHPAGRPGLRPLAPARDAVAPPGLVPQIYKLAEESNVALAVSLHAPDDELRNELVPINRLHPIAELLEACWHYIDEQNGRSVTFEYVMLDGRERLPAQARALARLLRGPPGQGQPDSLQSLPGHALPALPGCRSSPLPRRAAATRRDGDDPPHARRRHRCGLWPARRPRDRPRQPCASASRGQAVQA